MLGCMVGFVIVLLMSVLLAIAGGFVWVFAWIGFAWYLRGCDASRLGACGYYTRLRVGLVLCIVVAWCSVFCFGWLWFPVYFVLGVCRIVFWLIVVFLLCFCGWWCCSGGLVSTCGFLVWWLFLFWCGFRCLLFCLLCLYVWVFNSVVIALIFLLIGSMLIGLVFGDCVLAL